MWSQSGTWYWPFRLGSNFRKKPLYAGSMSLARTDPSQGRAYVIHPIVSVSMCVHGVDVDVTAAAFVCMCRVFNQ